MSSAQPEPSLVERLMTQLDHVVKVGAYLDNYSTLMTGSFRHKTYRREFKLAREALRIGIANAIEQRDREIAELRARLDSGHSVEASIPLSDAANAMDLAIICRWPQGFDKRLQHVWLDVVSFIPNVKLYDLQRTLAEFGYRMEVYAPASLPSSADGAGG